MWWSRVVLGARIVAVVWAGLVGLLEVLTYFEIVKPSEKLAPTIWTISLLMIGLGSLGGIISEAVKNRFAAKRERYDKALMSLFIELCRDGGVRFEELGGSVYRAARWRRTIRYEDGTKGTRLVRVHRFRPSGFPAPSGIAWTDRTGAVGECWTTRRPVYKDWHAVAKKYREPITAGEFRSVSKKTKNGFEVEQFNAIARKYSEMQVVPILDQAHDDRQIGVLSVDRLYVEDGVFQAVLDLRISLRLISATSAAVGSILKPRDN